MERTPAASGLIWNDSDVRKDRILRISVLGLGYVGTVSAGCFARDGHEVIGVDPVRTKVDLINGGQSPIIESEIGEIIASAAKASRLRATQDVAEAIQSSDLSFVCVGTPSQPNGNLDLRYIRRVCEQIGQSFRAKQGRHVVVIRSTVLPGTMRVTVIRVLDHAGGDRLAALYARLDAPMIRTNLETAEMVKYVNNSWHALKIGFANEIGNLCKA